MQRLTVNRDQWCVLKWLHDQPAKELTLFELIGYATRDVDPVDLGRVLWELLVDRAITFDQGTGAVAITERGCEAAIVIYGGADPVEIPVDIKVDLG